MGTVFSQIIAGEAFSADDINLNFFLCLTAASEEFLELTKSALLAALEGQ